MQSKDINALSSTGKMKSTSKMKSVVQCLESALPASSEIKKSNLSLQSECHHPLCRLLILVSILPSPNHICVFGGISAIFESGLAIFGVIAVMQAPLDVGALREGDRVK